MKSQLSKGLKTKAPRYLKIAAVYAGLLLLIEGAGQLSIRYLESKNLSGIEGEHLISYKEPIIGFALKKNLDVNLSYWHVHSDEFGFRGVEKFEMEKPPNEKRVFLVGGSTVFGWGVNENQSIRDYLQGSLDQLKQATPLSDVSIRVINAGVPWYASWHEAAQIFFKILPFSPDAIIVLDGLNDSALGVATSWRPVHEGYVDRPTQLVYDRRKQGENGTFLIDLLKLSPTFNYFSARLKDRKAGSQGTFRPEVWDQYLQIMDRTYTLSRALQIPIHFFYQPVQSVDKPITHYELTHNGTSMALPEFEATFRKQYLEGEKRVMASSLPVTSLRGIFKDDQRTIYLDGLHYNSLGNDIIASAIYQSTVKELATTWLSESTRMTAND